MYFSKKPISVIFGQNGSGKTTILKILFAILSKNGNILLEESVKTVHISYEKDREYKVLTIKRNKDNLYDWGKNEDLYQTSSILFGVHRGVNQISNKRQLMNLPSINILMEELNMIIKRLNLIKEREYLMEMIREFQREPENFDFKQLFDLLNFVRIKNEPFDNKRLSLRLRDIINELEHRLTMASGVVSKSDFLSKMYEQQHFATDFIKITDIEEVVVNQYNRGQRIISNKIEKALFETIEKAVEIDETKGDFLLPFDFDERIEANKNFILKAIAKQDSPLTKRIISYLETKDKKLTENSKIFRAMLLNIIERAEEPNPTLESVNLLTEIFNEHLAYHKKIIVSRQNAFIDLGGGKSHKLSELSSGERNLLSLLTLFLIIGQKREFLIIDEPEISLNIKWQRDFLPLLNKLNSKAQIIVASHSPSIAHNDSSYLVELI